MVTWSGLSRSTGASLVRLTSSATALQRVPRAKLSNATVLRGDHGHRTFVVQPSRWQWHKFKDMLHYYVMVGALPVAAVVFYCNLFIGPATLRPTPEDYVPQHWEYYRHPITRFIAHYIHASPQQNYEKFCHWLDEEAQLVKLRRLEKEIQAKMAERQDFQAFYYRPVLNKYLRNERIISQEVYDRLGEITDD